MDRDDAVLDLARCPHHCRCTPGVFVPFLTKLVSSIRPIVTPAVCSAATISWTRSRTPCSSQVRCVRNSCNYRGGTSASSAIGLTLFRAKSDNCPRTYVAN